MKREPNTVQSLLQAWVKGQHDARYGYTYLDPYWTPEELQEWTNGYKYEQSKIKVLCPKCEIISPQDELFGVAGQPHYYECPACNEISHEDSFDML